MYYKIAQLIQTSGQRANSLSEIYIAQPDSQKETLAGKLFILIEVKSKDQKSLKFINFLIAELNHNYYQNEKLILRERVSTIKTEHVFESALAKTNKNIGEYFQNPNNLIDLKSINATIGVIYENILHFSILGDNKAFLIYKNTSGKEPTKYKLTDISESAASTQEGEVRSANPHKLFTNIINGIIPDNAYFFFTNETLPEYLSNLQLVDIITTLPPTSAVEQIKNLLGHVNTFVSFLGIIIKNTQGQAVKEPEKIIRPATSNYSAINSLNTTEEKTERLLTPSGLIDFGKWFSHITSLFMLPHFGKSSSTLAGSKVMMTDKLSFKKRAGFKLFKNLWQNILNVLALLLQLLLHLPELFKKNQLNTAYNSIKTIPIGQAKTFKSWLANLSKKHKFVIGLSLVLIAFFIINSKIMSNNNKKQALQAANLATANTIETDQNKVDSVLLYDETGANTLLIEVKNLLASLPANDPQFSQLFARYQQELSKISHIVDTNPTELANFSNLNPAAKPTNLIYVNDKLYSADFLNNKIYTIELKNKLVSPLENTIQPINSLDFPTLSNNELYYYNNGSIIGLDTKTDKLISYGIASQNISQGINGMSIYNSHLYLLSPQNKQIYRYNQTANNFNNQTAWLNQPTDLSNATNLAIDSSIFILHSDGQITKYTRGVPAAFSLTQLTPPLEDTSKFSITAKSIYVLDAKNKRLVAFDKTGKLLAQYQLNKSNNLLDFTVDETNKQAYLLDGSSVEQINL